MDMTAPAEWDLAPAALTATLGGRPHRAYPALVSTQAAAVAWAREGAPPGALVVGDYQASARGWDGRPWTASLGACLGFSLVLRPRLPFGYEDLVYPAVCAGLLTLAPDGMYAQWPDRVAGDAGWEARTLVEHEPDGGPLGWTVASVLLGPVAPPRAELLAAAVEAVEDAVGGSPREVLDTYRARCATLGRRVRVRLLPLRPGGPEAVGRAADLRDDGGLVVETDEGRVAVVRPADAGAVEFLEPQEASGGARRDATP